VEGVDDVGEAEPHRELGEFRVIQLAAVARPAGVQELALGRGALPVLDLQVLAQGRRVGERQVRQRDERLLARGQPQQDLA
jgi:hypothetical protein